MPENDSNQKGFDVSKITNWKQVVAILVGYAFVQITTSITPVTAPYSMFSLSILAGFGALIIYNDRKTKSDALNNIVDRNAFSLKSNIELLKELKTDVNSRQSGSSTKQKETLDGIITIIDARLSTYRMVLGNLKNTSM